jgi:hypothetical protein
MGRSACVNEREGPFAGACVRAPWCVSARLGALRDGAAPGKTHGREFWQTLLADADRAREPGRMTGCSVSFLFFREALMFIDTRQAS